MNRLSYSVSVRRLGLARLGASLRELSACGIAEWRVDIADGTFTPDFGLGYDVLATVCRESTLPCHVHLMAERPDRFLDEVARLGAKSLTVPIEACIHAHRTISRIRELGMAPGVSLQLGSALTKLEYLLGMVDHVVLPVREHGAPVAPLSAAAFDRVRILRENINYHEAKAALHVEGDLAPADAARLAALGATRIVIDRTDVLHVEPLETSVREFMDTVARAKKTA